MLTIKNASRRMKVYNLDAAAFQERDGEHGYQLHHAVVVDHGKNGGLSARKIPRMLPTSLTLLAGEVRSGLPNEMLDVESIKADIARGELRLLSQTDDSKAEAEPEPAPAAPPAPAPSLPSSPSAPEPDQHEPEPDHGDDAAKESTT